MAYVAVRLDDRSKKELYDKMKPYIPSNWKVFNDHVTIHMGDARKGDRIGSVVDFNATDFGYSEGAMAVKVDTIEVDSKLPHVTIAVNTQKGFKPADSKNIVSWQPLKEKIALRGIVSVYKYGNIVKESFNSRIDSPKEPHNIDKLSFYDFDDTLIKSISPEFGREYYKRTTGKSVPGSGWWSKAESLDTDVFEFKPVSQVINRLNADNELENCITILLTNRLDFLTKEVINVLTLNGINLDEHNLLKRSQNRITKADRIKLYLDEYKNIRVIDVYDDDSNNIELFIELRNELAESNITLNIYQVNLRSLNKDRIITKI